MKDELQSGLRALAKALSFLNHPPRWFEVAVWLLVCGVVAWPRVFLWQLLPTYIWSADAEGYALPAFSLVDRGLWLPTDKRGPVYSLFLAATLMGGGDLGPSVIIQHIVGAAAALGCGLALRVAMGPASLIPIAWATASLGRYNLPVYFEHLIRNETLLFLLSSASLGMLLLAHARRSAAWGAGSGLAGGLLHLTKPIMPLLLPASILSILLRRDWPWAWRLRASIWFVAGFAFYAVVGFLSIRMADEPVTKSPQSGKLLYARVAQWTVLDSAPHRDIKDLIRADIESYRKMDRRETNLILNRTAVPKIETFVRQRRGGPRQIHEVCLDLALEAIAQNPGPFIRQTVSDLISWHTEQGFRIKMPKPSYLQDQADELEKDNSELPPRANAIGTAKMLRERADRRRFEPFYNLCMKSNLFERSLLGRRGSPVLACSIALPIVLLIIGRGLRPAFAVFFVMWWTGLLILSTVGRPMDRYLVPLVPIIFFALAGLLAIVWIRLTDLFLTHQPPSPN